MPRPATDGSGGTLLRTVFAKSPFSLVTKSEDEKPSSTGSDTLKPRRYRSPSFLLPRRSYTQQLDSPDEQDSNKPPFKPTRQRSFSHGERIRPLSSSKLAIHTSTDIPAYETINPSQQFGDEKFYGRVLHHGDAQTTHTAWRKKHEYLVLTDHYLLRFKTAKKAAEKFPWLFPINSQIRPTRPTQSVGSVLELSTTSGSDSPTDFSGTKSIIPLQRIIAVKSIQDGRNRVTLVVIWQTALCSHANTISLSVERVAGQPHWLESLSGMAKDSQSTKHSLPSSPIQTLQPGASLSSSADLFEEVSEYTVYRRQPHLGDLGYIMPDDLSKESPAAYSLIISQYKVDIVPLSRTQKLSAITLSTSTSKIASFGIVSLRQVSVSDKDDAFDLVFRNPQQPPVSFELASIYSQEIVQKLHTRVELLKPNWCLDPYLFRAPGTLFNKLRSMSVVSCPPQDSFDRVLAAHCSAWGLWASDIDYSVETDGEDTPRFQLHPRSPPKQSYSALEILAVFRALRYNDYFVAVSFADISLDRLSRAYDHYGHENLCLNPRMGQDIPIHATEMQRGSLLFQELSAIAMTNRKMRRLDFTNCIRNSPTQHLKESGDGKGSSIVEPLYRLCTNQNTNVDWIILNGIHLSRIDVDFVMGMLANRDCHLRAIELSGCQLDIWSLRLLAAEIPTQCHTLEVINISNNHGRLNPEISIGAMFANCQSLRTVNLSNVSLDPEPVPLLSADVLFSWRLEELRLSRTVLNGSTLDVLEQYLEAPNSSALRRLYVDRCGLRPEAIVRLLTAHSKRKGNGTLHIDISGNKFDTIDTIILAIRKNCRLTSLAWKFLEFEEPEEFEQLILAITANNFIQHLDLSELLLDFQLTGGILAALNQLFLKNQTLESLDISGNNSRLDNCSFGPLIHFALRGLTQNTTLKVLRIHDQNLSLDGATVLADILRTNTTLLELHCENNSMCVAGFSQLVDALRTNRTLQFLSSMSADRDQHKHSVEGSIIKAARPKEKKNHLSISRAVEKENLPAPVADAVAEVNSAVDAHWRFQQERLEWYLERNQRIAAGGYAGSEYFDAESQSTAAADDEPLEETIGKVEIAGMQLGKELAEDILR